MSLNAEILKPYALWQAEVHEKGVRFRKIR